MESKKINQLATNVNPQTSDLTTIGDPITGQLKKITWLQVAHLIGAQAAVTLQQVTDNGNTTTDPITTGGLTLTNLGTGVPQLTNGEFVSTYGYGLANGVATLDSGGKIPASQLPSSVMEYKGTWNASTNTPTLADGTGDNGDVYLVNVAGSQNLGSGTISFAVGDWVVYNGTIWQKSLNSNAVASVFGRTGTIVAQEGDYNIDQLGDVAITSAATNDYLRYNGSSWVNTQFPTFVSSDKLVLQVRNNSGATINKGTVVYINGATAGYPTIAKAQADADNTSAQTLGLVQDNISNNSNGVVVIVGQITGIDTSAYPAGTQLYLSGTTAGAFTSTKTLAPTHLVYVGIVTTQNAVNGVIEVKIQNGYELDEIHDVAISSVANNQGLFYESSTSLWKNKSIATVLGYTPEQPLTFSSPLVRTTNTISIPAATGSVNGYLTSTDWTTFNNKMANPMTTLGDIIFGGTSGNPNRLAGNTTTTKQYLSQTGTGTDSASPVWATIAGSDITGAALTKTDDTNVTLTLGGTPATALLRAASLTLGWTGELAISRGGTGASTKAAAFNALSPMTTLGDIIYGGASGTGTRLAGSTSASKRFLTQTGDGTNSAAPSWGTVSASDITGSALTKTDDTNVTLTLGGSASTALLNAASLTLGWTGTLAVSRGGTGAASFTAGQILYGNGTSAISSSSQFTFSPTGVFFINNTISAGGIAMNLTSTVNAAANNDILYGVRISPTFNNLSFTGVTQRALGVFGDVYINGTITSGAWNGSVIGSNYGGAGTVSGILKANGSGVVSAAVAGTDYVIPSALNSYLPLAGGTMTGQIVLKEGTDSSDYTKGLRFPNDPYGGGSDISGLRLYRDGAGTEKMVLELYIGDNVTGANQDRINFRTGIGIAPDNNLVTINDNIIWNAGNLTPQTQLNGTGFVKASGTTITYDNTSYLPLTGGTLTGALNGTSGSFSGSFTVNSSVFTDKTTGFVSYSIFQNGSKLTYAGGSGGHQFNDDANTVNLISLLNNGSTSINATAAAYGLTVTNVQDSSQGLLVRSTDADTTLYLARFQSSASATSQTWVDRFSIAKNGSTVIGDNIPAVNVRLWVKGEDQTASNYAMDVTDSLGQSIAWFRNDKVIRLNGSTSIATTINSTYGTLTVGGTGLTIADDGNAKLQIGRYSSGVAHSYIKLGANSNSLRITNKTDTADIFVIDNGGNVLIGKTTNAGGKLQVSNGTNTFNVDHNANGAYLTAATDNNVSYRRLSYDASEHIFLISATEKITITSGGALQATNNLTANSPSSGNTGEGIIAGTSFKIDAGGTGQSAKMYVVSKTLSDTYGSAFQIQFANSDDNKGFGYNINTSGGYETYVKDSGANWQKAVTITQDRYFRLATKGIQFNGDTAEANSLDDYEEGTWTPALTGDGNPATYTTRTGTYTKVGRMVTITYFIVFQKNTMTGGLRISGFPFTLLNNGTNYPQGAVLLDNLGTATNNITLQGDNGTATGDFIGGNGGTGSHVGFPTSSLGAGSMACRGTLTYFTA